MTGPSWGIKKLSFSKIHSDGSSSGKNSNKTNRHLLRMETPELCEKSDCSVVSGVDLEKSKCQI